MGIQVLAAEKIVQGSQENQNKNDNGVEIDNREEGEIVEDEYEDIISSDEEVSMRKRIAELEARNSELEKLANISGFYNSYDVGSDRHKLPQLDFTETDPPTKRNHPSSSKFADKTLQKNRTRYRVLSPSIIKHLPKHESSPPPPPPPHHEYDERSSREHRKSRKRKYPKSSRSRSDRRKERPKKRTRPDYSSSDDEELVDRNVLRLALRHESAEITKGNFAINLVREQPPKICHEDNEIVEPIEIKDDSQSEKQAESDESESLEVQELRLIALKSAFLKKGKARKERKELEEKKPYSPTDCLQPIICLDIDIPSPSPKEYHHDSVPSNNMEISPIPSPEILDDHDAKPVDMDLVDSSNSSSPIFIDSANWSPIQPIDQIPLPTNAKTDSRRNIDKNPILSPIPIRIQPVSSTPRSPIQPSNVTINVSRVEAETVEITSRNEASSPEPLDEEVNALRALLLAQKNSPKYNRDMRNFRRTSKEKMLPQRANTVSPEDNKIQETIESFLRITEEMPGKTAEILKEAVKRLQNKSLSDDDSQRQNGDSRSKEPITNNFVRAKPTDPLNKFPHDVDYRIFNPFVNLVPVQEPKSKPIMVIGATPRDVTVPPHRDIVAPPPRDIVVVPVKAKENQVTRSASRPNIIEIIPNAILPRISKKSPLMERTETDNVKPLKTEIPPKMENQRIFDTSAKSGDSFDKLTTKKSPSKLIGIEANANCNDKCADQTLKETVPQSKLKSPSAQKVVTTPTRSPRKRSLTAIEALQLKTQNLISNGKLISRNKLVATKLLNRAIHNNSTPTKRKTLLVNRPIVDQTKANSLSDRLITKFDVPAVKKLIICLNTKSETEESEIDDCDDEAKPADVVKLKTCVAGDLGDVASPMSLPMESPRDSPLTVVTTISNFVETSRLSPVEAGTKGTPPGGDGQVSKVKVLNPANESFQSKLDEFLKSARSKVDSIRKETITVAPKTPDSKKPLLRNSTPLAVRHLPLSAQLEYRRLVSRMQTLEKQKSSRNQSTISTKENLKVTISNDDKSPLRSVQSNIEAEKETTSVKLKTTSNIASIADNSSPVRIPEKVAFAPNEIVPTNCMVKSTEDSNTTDESIKSITKQNLTVVRAVNNSVSPKVAAPKRKLVASSAKSVTSSPKIAVLTASLAKKTALPSTTAKKTVPPSTAAKKTVPPPTSAKKTVPPSRPAKLAASAKSNAAAIPTKALPKTVAASKSTVSLQKPNDSAKKVLRKNTNIARKSVPSSSKKPALNSAKKPAAPNSTKKLAPNLTRKAAPGSIKNPAAPSSLGQEPSEKRRKQTADIKPESFQSSILKSTIEPPETLSECEKQYRTISTNLLESIAKTVKLVAEVRSEKLARVQLEIEMNKLRAKLIEMDNRAKEKDSKIARILPGISLSYKDVCSLKAQTNQLDQISSDLSRQFQAERNKFHAEQKSRIKQSSLLLSTEIKKLKDINSSCNALFQEKSEKLIDLDTDLKERVCNQAVQVDFSEDCCRNKDDARCSSIQTARDDRTSNAISCENEPLVQNISGPNNCLLKETKDKAKNSDSNCDSLKIVQSTINCINDENKDIVEQHLPSVDSPNMSLTSNDTILCLQADEIDASRIIATALPSPPVESSQDTENILATTIEECEQPIYPHTSDYISPLDFACDQDYINPNGILCPYQLMGQCDDKECKFEHLNTTAM